MLGTTIMLGGFVVFVGLVGFGLGLVTIHFWEAGT